VKVYHNIMHCTPREVGLGTTTVELAQVQHVNSQLHTVSKKKTLFSR